MPTTMILNQLLKSGLNQAEIKICFLTKDEVALTWENRHQNYSVVSVCEALRYMHPLNIAPWILSLSNQAETILSAQG